MRAGWILAAAMCVACSGGTGGQPALYCAGALGIAASCNPMPTGEPAYLDGSRQLWFPACPGTTVSCDDMCRVADVGGEGSARCEAGAPVACAAGSQPTCRVVCTCPLGDAGM